MKLHSLFNIRKSCINSKGEQNYENDDRLTYVLTIYSFCFSNGTAFLSSVENLCLLSCSIHSRMKRLYEQRKPGTVNKYITIIRILTTPTKPILI